MPALRWAQGFPLCVFHHTPYPNPKPFGSFRWVTDPESKRFEAFQASAWGISPSNTEPCSRAVRKAPAQGPPDVTKPGRDKVTVPKHMHDGNLSRSAFFYQIRLIPNCRQQIAGDYKKGKKKVKLKNETKRQR